MADNPNPEDKPVPKDKPDPDAGAKKALDAERRLRRDAEAEVKDLKGRLEKLEGEGKGESDKLTEQVAKLTADLDSERVLRLKAEVAAEKGLTPAQAKRLSGTSKEELETDADELLEAFPAPSKDEGKDESRRPPSRRPAADLKGGGDPTEEPTETDPSKLAESVPRL